MSLELDRLYHMDCLKGMQLIEPHSVDMVLSDIPYGMTQNKWDCLIPLDKLWEGYRRVLKPRGVVALTAQMPFTAVLGASNLKWLRYEWIWVKAKAVGFINANRAPLRQHESVLIFCEGQANYYPIKTLGHGLYERKGKRAVGDNYGAMPTRLDIDNRDGSRYPTSILRFNHEQGKGVPRFHQTQKPIALFEYLIRTYTKQGETVLDSCMGSGTTAVAAMNAQRRYLGFETDAEHYKESLARIRAHRPTETVFTKDVNGSTTAIKRRTKTPAGWTL